MNTSTSWALQVRENRRSARLVDLETDEGITVYPCDINTLQDLLDQAKEDLKPEEARGLTLAEAKPMEEA